MTKTKTDEICNCGHPKSDHAGGKRQCLKGKFCNKFTPLTHKKGPVYTLTKEHLLDLQANLDHLFREIPVEWDRCIVTLHQIQIYGWITAESQPSQLTAAEIETIKERLADPKKYIHFEPITPTPRDFVLVRMEYINEHTKSPMLYFTTSSTKYSAQMAMQWDAVHFPCQKWNVKEMIAKIKKLQDVEHK